MSKIRPDKINFDSDDFLVEINSENEHSCAVFNNSTETENKEHQLQQQQIEQQLQQANKLADEIVENANKEKDKIIDEANKNADSINKKAEQEAKTILDEANKQALELLENSKAELEKQITSSAHEGYEAGYNDGLEKVKEELSSKIEDFDKFCNIQSEIKNKIIKSASKDILNIIINISRKILLKEVDSRTIEEIIKKTTALLEDREEVNIILSEKYAKLLYDLQNNSLTEETELNFEKFNQYNGFKVIYNSKSNEDTIIVETPKERYDASINSQLDVVIRNIYENTSNGKLDDIEQTDNES